jgi:hypothetical protein
MSLLKHTNNAQQNYVNQTISLTGPRTYTIRQILDEYTKYTGRKVNLRILPRAEAIAWHVEHNSIPPEQQSFLSEWATMHLAWELGEADYVDPALGKILGRPPKTLEEQGEEIFSAGHVLDTKDLVGI